MKFFLIFCLLREDFILFKKMHKFLIINSVGLMLNTLERCLYPSHMKLFSIKLEDRFES